MEKYWEGKLNDRGEDFSNLIGAEIIQVGFHPLVREGGLTIEYLKGGQKHRLVLGYNDLGLWKEWEGAEKPSIKDNLMLQIKGLLESGAWDEIQWIEDDPLSRCYRFMSYDGEEVLKLDISQLKELPETMRKPFTKKYKDKSQRLTDISISFGIECL